MFCLPCYWNCYYVFVNLIIQSIVFNIIAS